MSSILAKKIFQGEHIVFDRPGLSSIDSAQINNTPTEAWLVRNKAYPDGDAAWQLTFQQPADDINVIKGVWIQYGQTAFLIDGNIDDVNAKRNGCCGSNATIDQNYAAGLPAYQAPVAKTYSIARTDDGSIAAASQALLDYSGNEFGGNALPNSFKQVSHNSGTGVSTYSIQAYTDPSPQKSDVITEAPIVISSNVYATALAGSNVYDASGEVDGVVFNVKGTAQTLASLVANLNADVDTAPLGAWTAGTNQVILTTTTRDAGVITLGQVAP